MQVRQVLEGRPLQLQLRGLEHMTDDPTDMHVLYLEVQGIGENHQQQQHLQELSDLVVRSFKEADLLVQVIEPVPEQLMTEALASLLILFVCQMIGVKQPSAEGSANEISQSGM